MIELTRLVFKRTEDGKSFVEPLEVAAEKPLFLKGEAVAVVEPVDGKEWSALGGQLCGNLMYVKEAPKVVLKAVLEDSILEHMKRREIGE